jgi:16S rRNA (uracil1498-N3)-methyltransferase
VAWEEEKSLSLRTALAGREQPAEVFLIIGPEGGLAEEEVEELSAWGALPVSLGPRILRAETAGPVTAALILYHFGELEPIPSTFLSSGE